MDSCTPWIVHQSFVKYENPVFPLLRTIRQSSSDRFRDEEALSADQRDLAEETGIIAARWESLGSFPSDGISTQSVHLFFTRDFSQASPHWVRPNIMSLRWVPWAEAVEQSLMSKIQDAVSTMCSLRPAINYRKAPGQGGEKESVTRAE
ncbi:NUDIX domain-containing protein [Sulfobacillus thermosulfidooxidans]|uniref:NUDIX domain-containing protein n=1 Tax=Sulfobacillus thermosulfidooxidans TaxID=28034 RepID=UPI00096BC53E|nr:NUDIX hydrolase [Sulfobacillus thermosulfidooxidans]OLZ11435.1 hypothetical protein BFX05_07490 [Sulfobacillus thermosulfidooxidans]OLZ12912.1 hypothetical protein BFX06_10080 [Sulfobacillus thermosulfidooxidans]OLZ20911.1 hypothetical protein BFX07_14075 [Sulfobacillus thermosulfidooxidans]